MPASDQVHFGVVLPQFVASFAQAREVAQAADESGLDSVWVVDHLVGIPVEVEPILEAWTELTAVAALTLVSYRPSSPRRRRTVSIE